MADYGKKIAELRKGRNLTQSELGKMLNVTSQAVSKWENNLSEPDLETIQKLCSILNISINEFFSTENDISNDESSNDNNSLNNNDSVAISQDTISQDMVNSNNNKAERANVENTTFVYGYCDDCKKMITTKDYTVENSGKGGQHIYCKECTKKRKKRSLEGQLYELRRSRNRGFIWGSIVLAVVLAVAIPLMHGSFGDIMIDIASALCFFTFTSQMFWSESVQDCFEFFLRSFRMPGVIFTLDLDGIIWFITVKLLLGVLAWLLSAIVFVIGFFITCIYSLFAFPFTLVALIRNISKLNSEISAIK